MLGEVAFPGPDPGTKVGSPTHRQVPEPSYPQPPALPRSAPAGPPRPASPTAHGLFLPKFSHSCNNLSGSYRKDCTVESLFTAVRGCVRSGSGRGSRSQRSRPIPHTGGSSPQPRCRSHTVPRPSAPLIPQNLLDKQGNRVARGQRESKIKGHVATASSRGANYLLVREKTEWLEVFSHGSKFH